MDNEDRALNLVSDYEDDNVTPNSKLGISYFLKNSLMMEIFFWALEFL